MDQQIYVNPIPKNEKSSPKNVEKVMLKYR
jgi:hypothetical protein